MSARKVGTLENLADMLTKGLRRELLDEHVAFVNGHIRGKRDRSALRLNSVGVSDAWAKRRKQRWRDHTDSSQARGNFVHTNESGRGPKRCKDRWEHKADDRSI